MNIRRLALFCLLFFLLGTFAVGQQSSSSAWVQLAKLSSSNPNAYWNGNSVAISGNVAAVGAPLAQFVSVYVSPAGGWKNGAATAILEATGEPICGTFGYSVAISGDVIVVGDPEMFCYPNKPGAAYVFVKPAGGWSGTIHQTATLTASDGLGYDNVGYAVSIDNDTVVVGAPFQENGRGSAYVFVKPVNGWNDATQTAKLTASDQRADEYLGISNSISGSTIVIGSPGHNQGAGTAYVFAEPATGWTNATQTAKLTASDAQGGDGLGASVSVSRQVIAAGAEGSNQSQGAVYVFVEPPGGWTSMSQSAKLTAAGGYSGDALGTSVATDGSVLVSGAPGYSNSSDGLASPFYHEGAAYIFVKPASGWSSETQVARLTGSDARLGAGLGVSAAFSGDSAIVGALFNNRNFGAGYVFGAFSGR